MSILTPVRRQLTAQAQRKLWALAQAWSDATGATSTNTMIGLGIRRGMLLGRLEEIAIREEAIPSGVIQVPPRGEKEGPPPFCAMAGFEVDLDALTYLPASGVARWSSRRASELQRPED